jgi:hypothetical protein
MEGFFFCIFLVCCIAILLGLLKPNLVLWWSLKRTRKTVLGFYLWGAVLSFWGIGAVLQGISFLGWGIWGFIFMAWLGYGLQLGGHGKMPKMANKDIPVEQKFKDSKIEKEVELLHEIHTPSNPSQEALKTMGGYYRAQEETSKLSANTPMEFEKKHPPILSTGESLSLEHFQQKQDESASCSLCGQPTPKGHKFCHLCVWKAKWPKHILDAPENEGRRERAHSTKLVSLNRDTPEGIFQGSSKKPYVTTLKDCTCKDFVLCQSPCKHIYRLAHELGVYSLDVKTTKTESLYELPVEEFDPVILEGLTEDEQKELHDLLNLWISANSPNEWVYEAEEEHCKALLKHGFLETLDMPGKLLRMKKIAELRAPLKEAGLKGFRTKEDVIQALLQLNPNAADELKQQYTVVRFQTRWELIRGRIRTYLKNHLPEKEVIEDSSDMGYEKKESWSHFVRHEYLGSAFL